MSSPGVWPRARSWFSALEQPMWPLLMSVAPVTAGARGLSHHLGPAGILQPHCHGGHANVSSLQSHLGPW